MNITMSSPVQDQQYAPVGGMEFVSTMEQINASDQSGKKVAVCYQCPLKCRVPIQKDGAPTNTSNTETKEVKFEETRLVIRAIADAARFNKEFDHTLCHSIAYSYRDGFPDILKEQLQTDVVLCHFCGQCPGTQTAQVPMSTNMWLEMDEIDNGTKDSPLLLLDMAGFYICDKEECAAGVRTAMAETMKMAMDFKALLAEKGIEMKNCLCCNKLETKDKQLKRCSRCKKVYFCDVNCQKRVWKKHKMECQPAEEDE